MDTRTQRNAAEAVRNDLRRVAVDDTVDAWKALVQLAVYIAFDEARRSIRINWSSIFDEVFDQVAAICDQSRSKVARHEEVRAIVWVADRNMAIRIQDSVVVKDM